MTERPPVKVTPRPTASTFAERAKLRAEAEANGENATPQRRNRTSLRAGANAEGLGQVVITNVQN